MSTCSRCGAAFGCAMADDGDHPCWCTELPAAVPVPGQPAACWCPACLRQHIAELARSQAIRLDTGAVDQCVGDEEVFRTPPAQ